MPPDKPNPREILNEAESDAAAGRYADALAKHVWFHENALKYEPGMYGVRLSFALGAWKSLAERYPAAREKLEAIRDEAAAEVRKKDADRETFHYFHDFAAISDVLGEPNRTRDLFVWLDSNRPSLAREVFEVAQPSLIKLKEYRLCGKYLDPNRSFEQILQLYKETRRIASEPQFKAGEMESFADTMFSNSTRTLVALLVLNGRKEDAERVAEQARREWTDTAFRDQLEKALGGLVPEPWP